MSLTNIHVGDRVKSCSVYFATTGYLVLPSIPSGSEYILIVFRRLFSHLPVHPFEEIPVYQTMFALKATNVR
jgi:hypothetical protein